MKVRPLADRILAIRVEEDETTSGGIIIPDTAKEKPLRARVIAVGPGRWDDDGEERLAMEVSVGDTILVGKYAGSEITLDGEEHIILREDDVLAVVS